MLMNMMFLGIIMRIVIIRLNDGDIGECMVKSHGHGDCGAVDDGGNDDG